MTSLSKDRRVLRPNRLKHDGHCRGCGGRVYIYFAVEYCSQCLGEMTEEYEDTRRNKPSLVRYYR